MKRISLSARRHDRAIPALLLVSALLLRPLAIAAPDNSRQSGGEPEPLQSGWTAWLDPVTGELSKEKPPEGEVLPLDDQALRHFSTSELDLIPETRPDGTVILDLQGRFRQGSAATIGNGGEVNIHRIGGQMFMSPDGREINRRLYDDNNRPDGNEP